ncbi:hypothetical protein [Sedimentibacter sp.]|uniref:hypothetical protein n=1 Tax=Sedimentibacter sp. TaxID=1960295 RepID=UPI0028A77313|nr:hypothetical protein [Sedimentibacter sp.]
MNEELEFDLQEDFEDVPGTVYYETYESIDYTENFLRLHEDLVKVNNSLLVLSALFSIFVTFVIVKEFFNRR